MIARGLARPLPPLAAAAAVLGGSVAVAAYCLVYGLSNGRAETFVSAFGWAVVNVAPWLAAIELLKRERNVGAASAILVGAAIVSVALGALLLGAGVSLFELWRRVPALLAASAAVALVWRVQARQAEAATRGPIPVPATMIDWVRSAGNYVEVSTPGRKLIHRATLNAVERELGSKGFVRIHRSTLVRRDRIVRVRGDDVVLHDGTRFPIGNRYRSAL